MASFPKAAAGADCRLSASFGSNGDSVDLVVGFPGDTPSSEESTPPSSSSSSSSLSSGESSSLAKDADLHAPSRRDEA